MTVEHTPLGHFQIPDQNDYESALKWLKEVTRVEDPQILHEALLASKKDYGSYNMDQAIQFAIHENDKKTTQQDVQHEQELAKILDPAVKDQSCVQSLDTENVKQQQTDTTDAVIDLTHENEKDDLQKAIALSLQEQHGVLGGQVTTEEEDISRVLEASLLESKVVGTKRKRGEAWQDPLNPHDRQRTGDWPVGLKNVGNTCWFAAVIQSLFHLPAFRHLVLTFDCLKDWGSELDNSARHHNLLFMRELRQLFALMVASERKYVDPSQALEVVREGFTNSASTDNQQDVSEFSHKVIEWLEDAHKLNSPDDSNDVKNTNPMTRLFYGHFKSEGINAGHTYSHDVKFGQYPLQMNGFCEIHESLESAVVAPEIESCGVGTSKFGQETWFTQLPSVLVFELSRFHFNQHLGVPEKIHNKFEFPEVIYMDRYLEKNKLITREKRELVRKLKEDRGKLLKRLEKYLNYGSGPKRVPLQDVLQYALEFVKTQPESSRAPSIPATASQEDIEMTSPQSNRFSQESVKCRASTSSQSIAEANSTPSPKHISEDELKVFQSCLNRWRVEVESDVKDLKEKVSRADSTIKDIYNEPSLQKVPYRLHAVLVHEGQAVSGHYWAYVFSQRRKKWLKFNDITVTEATWMDLQKESVGGYHHASAYCLMYMDESSENLFEGQSISSLKDLAEDLQIYVSSDNAAFKKEKEFWDEEQSRKKDCNTMTSDVGDVHSSGSPTHFSLHSPQMEHASLALKHTILRLEHLPKDSKNNWIKALEEAIQSEISEWSSSAQNFPETRVESVGVYFVQNGLQAEPFLRLTVLEQFSQPALVDTFSENVIASMFRRKAMEALNKLWENFFSAQLRQTYQDWHEQYSNFRKVVGCFVTGMEKYHQQKFVEALPYFVDAFTVNSLLVTNEKERFRGFDANILGHYRRECVLKINDLAISQFREEEDPFERGVSVLVEEYIVPGIVFLTSPNAHKVDSDTAVEIRNSWCNMIEFQVSEKKQLFLEEILLNLCENYKDVRTCKPSVPLRIDDLHIKFNATMQIIRDSGDLQLIENLSK